MDGKDAPDRPMWAKDAVSNNCASVKTHLSPDSITSKSFVSTAQDGDWKLYEDVPGKPGWIGNRGAISFRMTCGASHELSIEYLKSYSEIMGSALVVVQDPAPRSPQHRLDRFRLDGHQSEQTSVSHVEHRTLRCIESQELDVTLQILQPVGKYKVLSVMTC